MVDPGTLVVLGWFSRMEHKYSVVQVIKSTPEELRGGGAVERGLPWVVVTRGV